MAGIELLGQDAIPTGAHSIGRAGQAADQGTVGQPGQGTRLNRRSTDVRQGDMAEQLTEAIDLFIQQAGDRLWSTVTTGEAGATGDQHHLHLLIGNPGGDLGANLVQVVLEQYPCSEAVPGLGQTIDKHLARGVGFQGTGIADRQHRDVQRHERYICLGFHGTLIH
ncbi:hypothetical protein D3C80_910340 [compost metagenome]